MTQFDRAKKLSAEIVNLWVTQHGRGVIERWFAANPARLGKEWAQSGFLEFFFAATAGTKGLDAGSDLLALAIVGNEIVPGAILPVRQIWGQIREALLDAADPEPEPRERKIERPFPEQPEEPEGKLSPPDDTIPPTQQAPKDTLPVEEGPTTSTFTVQTEWLRDRFPFWVGIITAARGVTQWQQAEAQLKTELEGLGLGEMVDLTLRQLRAEVTRHESTYVDPPQAQGPATPPDAPEVEGDPPGETPPTKRKPGVGWVEGAEGILTLSLHIAAVRGNKNAQAKIVEILDAHGRGDLANRYRQEFGMSGAVIVPVGGTDIVAGLLDGVTGAQVVTALSAVAGVWFLSR